jgi:hypothetical protein
VRSVPDRDFEHEVLDMLESHDTREGTLVAVLEHIREQLA